MSSRIFQSIVLQMKDCTDRAVGVIDEQGAVIATRPAKEAFRHMDTSGFPFFRQVNIMQTKVATAGASVVLPKICAS